MSDLNYQNRAEWEYIDCTVLILIPPAIINILFLLNRKLFFITIIQYTNHRFIGIKYTYMCILLF